jgi:hypothetical protein
MRRHFPAGVDDALDAGLRELQPQSVKLHHIVISGSLGEVHAGKHRSQQLIAVSRRHDHMPVIGCGFLELGEQSPALLHLGSTLALVGHRVDIVLLLIQQHTLQGFEGVDVRGAGEGRGLLLIGAARFDLHNGSRRWAGIGLQAVVNVVE